MKSLLRALALALILVFPLLVHPVRVVGEEAKKPVVIATIFPPYDFARRIGGDRIELSMLLSPGTEAHSYEPTPKDMIHIGQADLLIAIDREMEPWAWRLFESASNVALVSASDGIELYKEGHEGHEHEDHDLDPHIWTDPRLAMVMARNIKDALAHLDPAGEAAYQENLNQFLAELTTLDEAFQEARKGANFDTMAFGSRFSQGYFVRRYDVTTINAYASCAEGADPSVRAMKAMIDEISEKNLPAIYFDPLNDQKVAVTLSTETGAKLLPFHSMHTVTPEQLAAGTSYLDLMAENLRSFQEGMN